MEFDNKIDDINKTIIVKYEKKLILKSFEGEFIEIFDQDIIGREGKWEKYLEKYKTISRKHSKFTTVKFSDENFEWFIEDLDSSNGTYINGVLINKGEKYKLNNNDEIRFSKSFYVVCILE